MFRMSVLIVLLVVFIVFWKKRKALPPFKAFPNLRSFFVQGDTAKFIPRLRTFSFSWSVALFLLLAASAFLPILLSGRHIQGLLLIIHVLLAPFFLTAFTLWILSSVQQMTFDHQDALTFVRGWKMSFRDAHLFPKMAFWLIFFLSLMGIGAIILSLFSIFSATAIRQLIAIHRYGMLLTFLIAILAAIHYFSLKQKTNDKEK